MAGKLNIKKCKIHEISADMIIRDEDGGYSFLDEMDHLNAVSANVITADSPHWNKFAKEHEEEARLLGRTYQEALEQVKKNGGHSVGIRLLSKGHKDFPDDVALNIAIKSFRQFFEKHPEYDMDVTLCVSNIKQEMYAKKITAPDNRK